MPAVQKKKPSKPRRDFPLFPHSNRQWAKKVRGKLHYFGKWEDPDAAERRWDAEKHHLLNGELPPSRSYESTSTAGYTVKELCNDYLSSQELKMEAGRIVKRTFHNNLVAAKLVSQVLGSISLDDVCPIHFRDLAAAIHRRHKAPSSRAVQITMSKAIFNWAMDNRTDRRIRFGSDFKPPSKKERKKYANQKPQQHYSAADCRKLLEAARQPMRTFILLGLNCGLGNEDLRSIEFAHRDGWWLDYPRPKTGEARRSKLWPETAEALEDYLLRRPEPRNPDHSDRVFINQRGNLFGSELRGFSPIGERFTYLARQCGFYRAGISFYSMRHSYRTAVDPQGDYPAINYTMGHVDSSMGARYVHEISDDRLADVSDFVRKWLQKG